MTAVTDRNTNKMLIVMRKGARRGALTR